MERKLISWKRMEKRGRPDRPLFALEPALTGVITIL